MKLGISEQQGIFPRTGEPIGKEPCGYLRWSSSLKRFQNSWERAQQIYFRVKRKHVYHKAKATLNES